MRTDPAVLLFGSAFYEDELVLRMSFEEQGVYQRLLWISFRNVGIPADPAVIAELLGLPFRGLSVKRFLTKVWPRIAPCWTPTGDGRLFQKRQEEERARRAAAKGDGPAAAAEDAVDVSARMRELARRRWGIRPHAGDAAPHADAHADAHASRNASRIAGSHLPPAPPSVQAKENHPNARDAHADAPPHPHGDARPHARTSAEGAGASHESQTEAEPDAVVQLQKALLATPLRSKLRGFDRSRELTKLAEELRPSGLTSGDVVELDRLDQQKAESRGALLEHWLTENIWREVLDEQRSKSKVHAIRSRTPAPDPLLEGVYGS